MNFDSADPRVAHFRTRVLPLLQRSCWRCHNPARMSRAGNLDQTEISGILRGGDSGPAVVPGKPDESLLMLAISWEDEDLQMPPVAKLDDKDIAAIRKWIAGGAVWVPPGPKGPFQDGR